VCKVVQLNTQISQGSAATDLRRGGIRLIPHLSLQFIAEYNSETKIIKIGLHLPKLSILKLKVAVQWDLNAAEDQRAEHLM